jgi:DNA-binding NarL/FixJ family response regulator
MVHSSVVVRILVVDDYDQFRGFVRSLLANSKLLIIGEASDGLEAVQKAKDLQPDLILLDIGLPKLDGIQAAVQIQRVSPNSKILFVSENRSWDIAEEALRTGAYGYLTKSNAGSELLPAIEEVLQGKPFVTASLVGPHLVASQHERVADARDHKKRVAPLPPVNVAIRHEVEFYSDDAGFVDGFAHLTEAALEAGNPVVLVATEPHRTAILQRLRRDSIDVDGVLKQGRYIPLDAGETLSKIMVADLPDPVRCARLVGDLILGAAQGAKGEHPRVAICGECAPTLLADGNTEAAIRLEHLWDEITRRYDADTLCGYIGSAVSRQESSPVFERICAEHSAVHGHALGY